MCSIILKKLDVKMPGKYQKARLSVPHLDNNNGWRRTNSRLRWCRLQINILALDGIIRLAPCLAIALEPVVNTLVPAVCKCLASSNQQVMRICPCYELGDIVFDRATGGLTRTVV